MYVKSFFFLFLLNKKGSHGIYEPSKSQVKAHHHLDSGIHIVQGPLEYNGDTVIRTFVGSNPWVLDIARTTLSHHLQWCVHQEFETPQYFRVAPKSRGVRCRTVDL